MRTVRVFTCYDSFQAQIIQGALGNEDITSAPPQYTYFRCIERFRSFIHRDRHLSLLKITMKKQGRCSRKTK